jgi:hypothetical protein
VDAEGDLGSEGADGLTGFCVEVEAEYGDLANVTKSSNGMLKNAFFWVTASPNNSLSPIFEAMQWVDDLIIPEGPKHGSDGHVPEGCVGLDPFLGCIPSTPVSRELDAKALKVGSKGASIQVSLGGSDFDPTCLKEFAPCLCPSARLHLSP